ncbi:cytochrome P450 [Collybia nuda]|uniref:Cytochrome P450 n=1 Tax=Collybia nuda TaxID=64659 RepID=A0A9P5XVB4_9AGAR|nr:cytochrome P450 [Collybia nuda]
MIHTSPIILVILAFCSFIAYSYIRRSRDLYRYLPLPPGPRKLPLIGNFLNVPLSRPWIEYHTLCKELDTDIIHLNVAGNSIIVLDSFEAATELLEKRSHVYSGRPRMPMVSELMGQDYNIGLMPYGERWRKCRKLLHGALSADAMNRYRPQTLKATRGLLNRLLDGRADLMDELRHLMGETIMSIAYGINILPKDDPYVSIAETVVGSLAQAAVPGAFLVDAIPVLKYVPDWMPFAGFKRKAKEWRKIALMAADMPFEAAKRKIKTRNAAPSFVSYCLEESKARKDPAFEESIIRDTAGTLYLASAHTTVAIIGSCVLGLLTNPDALKKAQQEIDLVLGIGQLPNFDDQESLPYVTAIVKEAFRWRDAVPLAFPHYIAVEDVYKGYRIPAGSIVMPNAWAMLHDENVYPKPFEFNPDRFLKDGKLDPEVKDPGHASFGFGRRQCPGKNLAVSSVWITVASIIAAFDITKAVDESGNVIEPTHEYLQELVYMPLPFKCSIKPRSKEVEGLLRAHD